MSEIAQVKGSPPVPRPLKITATLTSDALGDATVSAALHGYLVRVVTNPEDGPTADWDLTIIDEDGVDILAAGGVDRHTTTSEEVPLPNNNPVFVNGTVTVTGANMGNVKTAAVKMDIVAGTNG